MTGHHYFGNIDPAFPGILHVTKFQVTAFHEKFIS